ncbi:DNA modification methylase [Sphingomonas aliaeris]|uniref:Methyltransferase n=1 Tax=Sphingomonas aliaeris TaxID=2759526 RepID=A0A974NVF6_9SPHN|nr:DNA methyltransferase [Sphingomonas aliaeris]QQV77595.1 DNA modification methylase [Sphingomonas aliaeris]
MQASIKRYGLILPILIDQDGVIIGGEGVFEVAKECGFAEVPTVRVDHLDEVNTRLLRLALNRIAEESSWDTVELADEWGELQPITMDLDYEVSGFTTPEIDSLLHQSPTKDQDDADDQQTEIGAPGSEVTRVGDLWELGDHRVLCGSSLEMENLQGLMGTDLARMVLTDHPYNVKIQGNVGGLGKHKHREFVQASGEMSEAEFTEFLKTSIATLAAFCRDGALLYMFMDWRHMHEILSGIRAADLKMINMAVWAKTSPALGAFYRSQHELCFIAKKGNGKHRNNIDLGRWGRTRSNVWTYAGVNSFGAGRDEQLAMHSTCKNVSMLVDAIRDVSDRGEIILDGFLGSGSTLIAAERTGRICRGLELDPLYVDTIVRRWERVTGGIAVLQGTKETMEQVAERRSAESFVVSPRARTRVAA